MKLIRISSFYLLFSEEYYLQDHIQRNKAFNEQYPTDFIKHNFTVSNIDGLPVPD